MTQDTIAQQYLELATQRKQIPNIYRFANWTKNRATELKKHFPDHNAVLAHIWQTLLNRTLTALASDLDYPNYAAYEKLLAFHFTFIQIANDYRTILQLRFKSKSPFQIKGTDLNSFKDDFLLHAKAITKQGKATGELAERMLVSDKLDILLWYQFRYIIRFWAYDESAENTLTDAAIEKSTQWVFELMSHNLLDSSFDFGKFFLQNLPFNKG